MSNLKRFQEPSCERLKYECIHIVTDVPPHNFQPIFGALQYRTNHDMTQMTLKQKCSLLNKTIIRPPCRQGEFPLNMCLGVMHYNDHILVNALAICKQLLVLPYAKKYMSPHSKAYFSIAWMFSTLEEVFIPVRLKPVSPRSV